MFYDNFFPNYLLFSFCGAFNLKRLVKAPRISILTPILRVVVQASTAFPPFQSAAGGLLSIAEDSASFTTYQPRNSSPTACLCETEDSPE